MKTALRVLLLLVALLVTTTSFATISAGDAFNFFAKKDPMLKYRHLSAKVLLDGGHGALKKKRYKEAIEYFQALDTLYPFNPETRIAQRDIIKAYYQNGDKAAAVAAADRYLRLYPRGPDADYAYFMKGSVEMSHKYNWVRRLFKVDPADRNLKPYRRAYIAFKNLVYYFPNSPYAARSRRLMRKARNVLARHQLKTATFYYQRNAFVGAANRAIVVVRDYQDTPYAKEALNVMVKSYHMLGEERMADDARRMRHQLGHA